MKNSPRKNCIRACGRRSTETPACSAPSREPHDTVEKPRVLQDQQTAAGAVDHAGPGLRDHGVCFARTAVIGSVSFMNGPCAYSNGTMETKGTTKAECFHLRKSFLDFHITCIIVPFFR